MKIISRRSFLGKLTALVIIPFLPVQALKKKLSALPDPVPTELIPQHGSFKGEYLISSLYPDQPLGIARRNLKDGELIEYSPYAVTKDIIPINLIRK